MAATSPAAAQVSGDRPTAAATSVTLEQVAPANGARGAGADLDVQQPARPPRAAAVTSSEVSDRADGRALATAPIGGSDRCDATGRADRSDLCRQRIEARAGQYGRPRAVPVSPEARLMLLIDPKGPTLANGRQAGAVSGLNDPGGPAEQLAGALRDRAARDADGAAQGRSTDAGAVPPGVPAVVVLPTK